MYDFVGYATKYGVKCADNRCLLHGAFSDCDGETVPLVWNHMSEDMDSVIGHALLEERDDGVVAYCSLNDTPYGKMAKQLVKHRDLTRMSIFANDLKQDRIADDLINVTHGMIREVSLVPCGANPQATITDIYFEHRDPDTGEVVEHKVEGEAIIHTALADVELVDEVDEEEMDMNDALADAMADVLEQVSEETGIDVEDLLENDEVMDSIYDTLTGEDGDDNDDDNDVEDSYEEYDEDDSDEAETSDEGGDSAEHTGMNDSEEARIMHKNVFVNVGEGRKQAPKISQDEMRHALQLAAKKKPESLSSFLQHYCDDNNIEIDIEKDVMINEPGLLDEEFQHGITNLEMLFPDYRNLQRTPTWISRPMGWVQPFLNSVSHTPFMKIRTRAADITKDEARAKGYIKGNKKTDEQFNILQRVTDGTTIYKKQSFDRDDVIDITDFDLIAWVRGEMRVMLQEEIARAILVGDGRDTSSPDKIKEDCIRPVWSDEEQYSVHVNLDPALLEDNGGDSIESIIDAIIRSKKFYKGTGNPTLYIGNELLTRMRLLRDRNGYRRYASDQAIADDLRVARIQEIQLLDDLPKRKVEEKEYTFGALLFNPTDYTVGTNQGGQVSLFDSFDIDYNKQKYLIETRMSGALTVPMSALVFEFGEDYPE